VELKMNSGSRRHTQDDYHQTASKRGMGEIVDGIHKILKKSAYGIKYRHLLTKLSTLHLPDGHGNYSHCTDEN